MTSPYRRVRTVTRRAMLLGAAGGLVVPAAFPQSGPWPARPIRIVVPWPAGGVVDVAARPLAARLQTALAQPVVVENRLGAGGAIGADQVAKAPADGHTLLFTTSALTIATAMRARLPFDVLRDLEPIALVGRAPSVLVVGPGLEVGSVGELIARARANPGRLSYASAGIGSPAHMAGEMFKALAKVFVVHIPYTGAPAAMNDQLAGRVDFQFANAAVALPQVRAGRVRALAVTSAQRFAALPQVPTLIESGLAGFEADQWLGLLGPRGLPQPVLQRLSAESSAALAAPELRQALAQAGIGAAEPGTPAAFAAALRQDLARWTAVVQAQGIQPE